MDSLAFSERQWVSRHSLATVGLEVYKAGALADADANQVTVRMETLADPPVPVFQRTATHTGTGVYEALLSSVETSAAGLYQVVWSYAINGVPQTFEAVVEVGQSNPAYDRLDVGFKDIIESVYIRFADLFDSPFGGPHLQVYFQTNFGRGRMAQLLQIAVGRLNTIAQPHGTYSLEAETNPFPYGQWGPLLEQGLYIETIKHLIRSYTEQPDAQGVVTARLDRRDYTARWREVLDMETEDYKGMLDSFKIANMGLGRVRVLVSGGIYGSYSPRTRMVGALAARGQNRWAAWY